MALQQHIDTQSHGALLIFIEAEAGLNPFGKQSACPLKGVVGIYCLLNNLLMQMGQVTSEEYLTGPSEQTSESRAF